MNATQPKRRILVLEDDEDLRFIYARTMRRAGFEVREAATLADANRLIDNEHFDVVFFDIRLEGERSTDILRARAQELRKKGTYIIVISAESQYADLAEELGAHFFLVKPVELSSLVTLVERLLSDPEGANS
ncbi:MAG: response regulator [Ardenticatenia bacterium]|nr:MAG: response regulator [Ardenticatenia bacterium]